MFFQGFFFLFLCEDIVLLLKDLLHFCEILRCLTKFLCTADRQCSLKTTPLVAYNQERFSVIYKTCEKGKETLLIHR